eukprot:363965-Chlamydomonas_euryale.AAC.5
MSLKKKKRSHCRKEHGIHDAVQLMMLYFLSQLVSCVLHRIARCSLVLRVRCTMRATVGAAPSHPHTGTQSHWRA